MRLENTPLPRTNKIAIIKLMIRPLVLVLKMATEIFPRVLLCKKSFYKISTKKQSK